MNNYQSITASPEVLAAFLGSIPAIETPWDDAFHRLYCSSCAAADCDDCRRPERDSPLWWLGLPAAEVEKPKAIPGTVVYVHPGGRYCVLEFDVGRREPMTIRESFQLIDGRVAE